MIAVVSCVEDARVVASLVLDRGVVQRAVGVVVVLGSSTCSWKSPGFTGLINGDEFGILLYCSSVRTRAR